MGLPLFVVLACLIGIAEEMVYRGWMQGRLSALGWPAAVLFAAVAHAVFDAVVYSAYAKPPWWVWG
jgi:membrane protease YdiL (CAAX protease family)